jgi:hypothetical protein
MPGGKPRPRQTSVCYPAGLPECRFRPILPQLRDQDRFFEFRVYLPLATVAVAGGLGA